ncbi:hypothetical protein [uncultured Shewanella sp.]|uniref:hypothetical protein n=1 Tax=uncultured Shewanella sp. TaxID=173975 RepID=UPI00261DB0AB|nr:hypothetical protein [uncultured Shewanella sp.]
MTERAGLDLSDFTPKDKTVKEDKVSKSNIKKVSEDLGFVSREPSKTIKNRRKNKASPYTTQKNFKVRSGVKELLDEIGIALDTTDYCILEDAILALIEKEGLDHIKSKYETIITKK